MTRRAVAALLQRIAPQTQRRDPVLAGEAASTHHGATPPGPKAAAAAPRAGQGQRARICPCSPWPAGRSPLGQAGHRRQLSEEASGAGAAGKGSRKRVTAPGTAGKDSAGGARQPSALHSAATHLGGAGRPTGPPECPRPAGSARTRPATPAAGQRSVPASHRCCPPRAPPAASSTPAARLPAAAPGQIRRLPRVLQAGIRPGAQPSVGGNLHRQHRRGWLGQTVR